MLQFWAVFFLGGAVLCLYPEIGQFFKIHKKTSLLVSSALFLGFFAGYYNSSLPFWSLSYPAALAWFIWNLTGYLSEKQPPEVLTHTFFLYASHWLIARNVNKLVCVMTSTDMIWGMVCWLILPPLIILICFLVRKILGGRLQGVWKVLNGGR